MERSNTDRLIFGVALVLVIVGVIVFGLVTSNNINNDRTDITANKTQITAIQGQLATTNTQITSLSNDLTKANSQLTVVQNQESNDVKTINSQISSVKDQIAALSSQVNAANATLSSLQSNISSSGTDLATLKSQITTITSQLTSFQNTISSLQSSVTSLQTSVATLQTSAPGSSASAITLASSQFISQNGPGPTLVSLLGTNQYYPNYNGYFYITGSSSSPTSTIRIHNNTTGIDSNTYSFGNGTTITAPVTSGAYYSIYFASSDIVGTSVTATLTVTYYNTTTSTTTGAGTILTSSSFTQNGPGPTPVVSSYTPSYSGYFTFTGSSTSSTTYVRVHNNSTNIDVYNNLVGVNINFTAQATAGNNYSIYIGSSDAPGINVTVTLTATYYSY